ncbi:hypothetical protein [Pseudonocardia nigra]|uniref:hypothetical protein n=1 Tax=Pseudonocardia nigra TaxID=1921578 RepID=UPI001C5D9EC8|nr:hypothetical protein [Pseudonocardia nigra]
MRQELAPEVVAVHFLASMVLVAAVTVLVDVLRRPAARPRMPARWIGWLVVALPVVLGVVLVLGALVTGSGPHAGDERARRFALDPELLSRVHADAVLVFLALLVVVLVALHVTAAPPTQRRAAWWLVAASLAQGAVGYVQYVTALPVPLVAAHVVGAALVTVATTHLVVTVVRARAGRRGRQAARSARPSPASR